MAGLLSNFRNTVILSVILALVMVGAYSQSPQGTDGAFWQAVLRWLHTFFGILWIGLLYYFNFVQIRKMPEIPAELKPGISKYIAPEALFWFRYAALATWIMGVILAFSRGYLFDAITLGALSGFANPQVTFIGLGMWLATIMFINVWGVIWPNQKRALGIVPAEDAAKARSASVAMMASRTNLILSLPMLYCMVTQTHVGG